MTRPPGRRGGGGRAPKIRRSGGRRGGRRGGGESGCLVLIFLGTGLTLGSLASLTYLWLMPL